MFGAAIELTYRDASKWKNEAEFVEFVAQTLHLPEPKYWATSPRDKYSKGGASVTCSGLTVRAGFHVIIGSPPAPGGPVAIAFPFIIIEDDNSRLKLGRGDQRSEVRDQKSEVRSQRSVNLRDKVEYRM